MRRMKMLKTRNRRYPKDCAGTAVQIAYEYPDWDYDQISDMWACIIDSEGRPDNWDEDTLIEATTRADILKREGNSYNAALKKLTRR
jgi:hypothetical protein